MTIKRIVAGAVILLIGLSTLLITGSPAHSSASGGTVNRMADAATCQAILDQAMNAVQSSCDGLERNKACYGHNLVKTVPNSSANVKFDVVGDRAALQDIQSLVTSPLDMDAGTWGLSLLKVQASLPDSMPGQNITFLVFGDTSIENTSGDMKAFYFTSGLAGLNCKEAPTDGILIRSPQHTEVTFNANGVQVTIASTIMLRATRGQSMSVELIEGHARLNTPQGEQTLQPGQMSSVTLGGDNGMKAISAPSQPVTVTANPASTPISAIGQKVDDSASPGTVSIEGCVTSVQQGSTITINKYQIAVGTDGTLNSAEVGDCIHLVGVLQQGPDGKFFVSVTGVGALVKHKDHKDGGEQGPFGNNPETPPNPSDNSSSDKPGPKQPHKPPKPNITKDPKHGSDGHKGGNDDQGGKGDKGGDDKGNEGGGKGGD